MMKNLGWGVCRLSVVPVRKTPDSSSLQITQLLFGDQYSIIGISEDNKWIQIRIFYDQSEGWLNVPQHHGITEEYYTQICHTEYRISTEITTQVLYKKNPLTIVLGSIVPISSGELFIVEEQIAFNGESKPTIQRRDFEFVKSIAKKYLWSPYLQGGKTPFGIDSSGFVQMVYKISGYPLFRDLISQSRQGQKFDFEDAKAGDLAFFTRNDSLISNVGIVFPDNKVVHTHAYVRMDSITNDGIINSETDKLEYKLHSIRRIM